MSQPLDNMPQTSADWRKIIRINTNRTYVVIGIFFLVYFSVGMLVDMFIGLTNFPDATMPQIFSALITFKIFPTVTIVMLCVAAVSLMITFAFHDQLMLLGTEYFEVTPTTARNVEEQQLYNVVEEMKIAAGLQFMPKVYVINADYMNAFASGYSEKSAMVAITQGLMSKLNRSELSAVMAHELSHIRHMDIKLTLMASVLANLTVMVLDMFFYNALFGSSSSRSNGKENKNADILLLVIIILRYLIPLLNIVLLLYLSRTREYMADAGSVQLLRDNHPLASALIKISGDHEANKDHYDREYQNTPHENVRREAYIFDPIQAGIERTRSLSDFFSTHPSLNDRLEALGFKYDRK